MLKRKNRVTISSRWSQSHQPSMYASPNPSDPSARMRAYNRSSRTRTSHGPEPFRETPVPSNNRSTCALNDVLIRKYPYREQKPAEFIVSTSSDPAPAAPEHHV